MKKYNFEYIKEEVEKWNDKEHVTRQMLNMIPHGLFLYVMPPEDPCGYSIDNINEWHHQRDEYLDKLWLDLGGYSDES